MQQYSQAILDRYYKADFVGVMTESDQTVRTGQVGTPDNGEVVRVQMKIIDGKIAEICFKAQGSCATIAAAQFVCETLHHAKCDAVQDLTAETIARELALPKVKLHSALLAIDACKQCLLG